MKFQMSNVECRKKAQSQSSKSWLSSRAVGGFVLGILSLLAHSSFVIRASAQDDPATEQATFQLAPGFEVNLFASETNGVVKPIQIRFDARGRLWLIGSTVYQIGREHV